MPNGINELIDGTLNELNLINTLLPEQYSRSNEFLSTAITPFIHRL